MLNYAKYVGVALVVFFAIFGVLSLMTGGSVMGAMLIVSVKAVPETIRSPVVWLPLLVSFGFALYMHNWVHLVWGLLGVPVFAVLVMMYAFFTYHG